MYILPYAGYVHRKEIQIEQNLNIQHTLIYIDFSLGFTIKTATISGREGSAKCWYGNNDYHSLFSACITTNHELTLIGFLEKQTKPIICFC